MEGPNLVEKNTSAEVVSKPSIDKSILQNTNDAAQTEDSSEKVMNTQRKIPLFIKISAIVFIFLLLCLSGLFFYTNSEKDKIVSGTTIKLTEEKIIDISNISYQQAQNKLDDTVNDFLNNNFELTYGSDEKNVSLRNIGITVNYSKAKEEISESTYGPNMYDSILKHIKKTSKSIPVISEINIDESKLNTYVSSEFKEIEKKPEDAVLFINKDKQLEIKKEILGLSIDKSNLSKNIVSFINNNKFTAAVPTINVKPSVTEETLKDMMPVKQISKFGTNFGGSNSGRIHNIKLAASRINNTLLKPGEEFEFFKYVGDTASSRDGFQKAGVYVNGTLGSDYGGGICQVSTTLYNAALLADLQITERSPHSMPVHYVPLGLDATVSQGAQTLKFINNTDKYLLIKSQTTGSMLYFSIYGFMEEGKSVKVRSNKLSSLSAVAYRDVYMNGKKVRTDNLGKSVYKSLN